MIQIGAKDGCYYYEPTSEDEVLRALVGDRRIIRLLYSQALRENPIYSIELSSNAFLIIPASMLAKMIRDGKLIKTAVAYGRPEADAPKASPSDVDDEWQEILNAD